LAHGSLFGNFDYNLVPIALPRTKVVAHTAADKRHSFAPHSRVGWYIGPSPKHYRCHCIYFPDTMAKCNLLKVEFFPEKLLLPQFLLWNTSNRQQLMCYSFKKNQATSPQHFGPQILNAFE